LSSYISSELVEVEGEVKKHLPPEMKMFLTGGAVTEGVEISNGFGPSAIFWFGVIRLML
jgi:hypothetical protein